MSMSTYTLIGCFVVIGRLRVFVVCEQCMIWLVYDTCYFNFLNMWSLRPKRVDFFSIMRLSQAPNPVISHLFSNIVTYSKLRSKLREKPHIVSVIHLFQPETKHPSMSSLSSHLLSLTYGWSADLITKHITKCTNLP